MGTRPLVGTIYADRAMRHGDIRVEGPRLFMTRDTWRALEHSHRHALVYDVVEARGDGTYPIPVSLLQPDAAEELRTALRYAEPGRSATCVLPTCLQPTAVYHPDGFPLCRGHAEILADWDDLTA